MTTSAQLEANRQNCQLSRGPKTPPGKARSSRNALRHGLRSELPVLPREGSPRHQDAAGMGALECDPGKGASWTGQGELVKRL